MNTVEIERMKGQIKAHQHLINELLEHVCGDLDDTGKALLASSIERGIPLDASSEEQKATASTLVPFVKQVDQRCSGLTFRRKERANDILDEYAAALQEGKPLDGFEMKIRERLGIGWQTLKLVVIDMFEDHSEYKDLAAHYMKSSPKPSVGVSQIHQAIRRGV